MMGKATHYDISIWIDSKIPFVKEWVVSILVRFIYQFDPPTNLFPRVQAFF